MTTMHDGRNTDAPTPPAAGTHDGIDPDERERLSKAARALRGLRRPPGEQTISEQEYERLVEAIKRLG